VSVKAILTDIEGTTTSISFVKEVLFPFARARLSAFCQANAELPEVAQALDAARAAERNFCLSDQGAVATLLRWIDDDIKSPPLKTLQGLIWAEGYAQGELQGHIYPDTAPALRRWHGQGIALYIYSSGSVAAQKLLFGHTAEGDLTPLFSGYFDATTGPKLETASYRRIASLIAVPPSDILFLSDHVGELAAARDAGMRTLCLERGETPPTPGHSHAVAKDFTSIAF